VTGAGFLPVWTATMAAMTLPSTVRLLRLDYATTHSWARLVALAAGYLSVWIAFGCAVLAVDVLAGDRLLGMVVGATILLEKLTSVSTVPVSAVLAAGAVAWAP